MREIVFGLQGCWFFFLAARALVVEAAKGACQGWKLFSKRSLSVSGSESPRLILLSARVVPGVVATKRAAHVDKCESSRGTSRRPNFGTGLKAQGSERAPTRSKREKNVVAFRVVVLRD